MSLAGKLAIGTAWVHKAYGIWENQAQCNSLSITMKVIILRNHMK